MTREEEIVKYANEICNDPKNDYKSTLDLCIMMGELVDEHPREGLIDIVNLIDFIYSNTAYFDSINDANNFIENLRKYIEEQQ